jgi:dihydrodipicolinate synthase/N-acetylneuraminate lyase
MMQFSFPLPLRGIIPPMVTPLTPSGKLDVDGLERLIEHLLAGPVSGLFLLGTTGEGMSLSLSIREELVQRTCRQVDGRIPVLVGISSACMAESIQMARFACENGADAVVAMPPFYIQPTQYELADYLGALVPLLPLPLFLYNMPAITTVCWDLNTVRRAMDEPKIIGVKDSSGDMKYFQYLCDMAKERPDWTILIGPEELLLPAMNAGGHGGISGGANVFPQLYVALHKAAQAGNEARVESLLTLARHIQKLIFPFSCGIRDGVRRVKAALECLGICGGATASPLRRASDEERESMRLHISALSREIAAALAQNSAPSLNGTHFHTFAAK